MTKKSNNLNTRALRRLRGERTVGLTPKQVRRNVIQGPDPEIRDSTWPTSAETFNSTARSLDDATSAVRKLEEI